MTDNASSRDAPACRGVARYNTGDLSTVTVLGRTVNTKQLPAVATTSRVTQVQVPNRRGRRRDNHHNPVHRQRSSSLERIRSSTCSRSSCTDTDAASSRPRPPPRRAAATMPNVSQGRVKAATNACNDNTATVRNTGSCQTTPASRLEAMARVQELMEMAGDSNTANMVVVYLGKPVAPLPPAALIERALWANLQDSGSNLVSYDQLYDLAQAMAQAERPFYQQEKLGSQDQESEQPPAPGVINSIRNSNYICTAAPGEHMDGSIAMLMNTSTVSMNSSMPTMASIGSFTCGSVDYDEISCSSNNRESEKENEDNEDDEKSQGKRDQQRQEQPAVDPLARVTPTRRAPPSVPRRAPPTAPAPVPTFGRPMPRLIPTAPAPPLGRSATAPPGPVRGVARAKSMGAPNLQGSNYTITALGAMAAHAKTPLRRIPRRPNMPATTNTTTAPAAMAAPPSRGVGRAKSMNASAPTPIVPRRPPLSTQKSARQVLETQKTQRSPMMTQRLPQRSKSARQIVAAAIGLEESPEPQPKVGRAFPTRPTDATPQKTFSNHVTDDTIEKHAYVLGSFEYTKEDLDRLLCQDKETFAKLQHALKNRGAITNTMLQQRLHIFVRHSRSKEHSKMEQLRRQAMERRREQPQSMQDPRQQQLAPRRSSSPSLPGRVEDESEDDEERSSEEDESIEGEESDTETDRPEGGEDEEADFRRPPRHTRQISPPSILKAALVQDHEAQPKRRGEHHHPDHLDAAGQDNSVCSSSTTCSSSSSVCSDEEGYGEDSDSEGGTSEESDSDDELKNHGPTKRTAPVRPVARAGAHCVADAPRAAPSLTGLPGPSTGRSMTKYVTRQENDFPRQPSATNPCVLFRDFPSSAPAPLSVGRCNSMGGAALRRDFYQQQQAQQLQPPPTPSRIRGLISRATASVQQVLATD